MEEEKIIVVNKQVKRNYDIVDTKEAGIELQGYEVKSVRQGKVNLKGSFVKEKNGEFFVYKMFIGMNPSVHSVKDERRRRKLLLHKYEIIRWSTKVKEKGYTIVPLDVHTVRNRIKLRIALVRSKKLFGDKRKKEEKRLKKEIDRARRLR